MDPLIKGGIFVSHANYRIYKSTNRMTVRYEWHNKNKIEVPNVLLNYVNESILIPNNLAGLDIWCEYHLDKKIFRSHPNYHGGGIWMDWCIIGRHRCSSDTRKEHSDRVAGILTAYPPSHYPAKIFGFFKNRNNEWMSIVQSCIAKENSIEDSCLTERWHLEYEDRAVRSISNEIAQTDIVTYITTLVLRVTPCSNIIDRVYVVEETQGIYESITDDHSRLVVLVKNVVNGKNTSHI
jgi:hypothetical protein